MTHTVTLGGFDHRVQVRFIRGRAYAIVSDLIGDEWWRAELSEAGMLRTKVAQKPIPTGEDRQTIHRLLTAVQTEKSQPENTWHLRGQS